jgi:GntR family transcriptional regulator
MTDEPSTTAQITSDLRTQIQNGTYGPGALLPSEPEIARAYNVSRQTARTALQTLEQEGLVTVRPRRGRVVRVPPRRAVRDSERHQAEKDNAILPEEQRGKIGEAETNLAMSIGDQHFTSEYDTIPASSDLADKFGIVPTTPLLRRHWTSTEPKSGNLLSTSTSYIPKSLVEANPAILDASNEPWPGGTLHALSTVGIEIMKVVDEVTARMPSSAEAQAWDLPSGIPLLFCRRLSFDRDETLIEISDAWYPADRTELRFVTPLKPWDSPPEGRKHNNATT